MRIVFRAVIKTSHFAVFCGLDKKITESVPCGALVHIFWVWGMQQETKPEFDENVHFYWEI